MNKFKIAIMVGAVVLMGLGATDAYAKGGGGGRAVGGARVSSTRVSTPKPSTSVKPSTPKPTVPKPVTPKPAKPNSATVVKTDTQKKVVDGKTYSKKSYVVDDKYKPNFQGGYTPVAGSQVYYRSSAMDWFPIYYILTHDSHKEAVVKAPDGTEKVVKEEGKDTMYFVNWILTILLLGGIGVGIVYLINKFTKK